MPVSTFSSGNSAVRDRTGRSNLLARWGSTRERILDDERRVSLSEINEMDGTGLHERGDWPMRPLSPSIVEEGKVLGAMEREEWVEGDHHITDVAAEAGPDGEWVVERDVSDIDEEEELELEKRWQAPRAVLGARESVVLPVKDEGENTVEQVVTPDADGLGDEVSPERSEHSSSQTDSWTRISPVQDQASSGGSTERQHDPGFGEENDDLSELRHSRDTRDYDPTEARDIATPIPHQWQNDGSEDREWTPLHSPHMSPRANGRTTPSSNHTRQSSSFDAQRTPPVTHARHSSMVKGTPPGGSSRRSSMYNSYNTTQVPPNKDRVRYSWQSAQDDEPNRPRIHIIKLISNTATASAGFPQGEAFGFSISSGGRRIAAYNSARLFVLQTAALPVGISQDYALKRRPLAVEIVDDGSTLAILADQHTVNIYDLSHHRLRRSKTIKLDFPTSCIALAPMGGLLAVAYEGGVEIFSLDPSALPTDRRAVRSQRMDRLSFSADGSTLLGTTTRINVSSTVIVNVPVFPSSPDNIPTHEELKEAWCSELLHPENIRNSSHATFMRENRTTCNERLYAWNGLADTFGILNTADMQYGHIDFPVVISPPLSTCGGLGAAIHSCPAIDEHGDTVAMIVNDRTIRLYIVPHKTEEDENAVEAHSIDHELDEGYGCPFNEVRWVHSHASLPAPLSNQTQVKGRLLVTSPGGVVETGLSEEMVQDVEGGRIILFDFDPQFAGQPGQTFSLTLGKSPPQALEEAEFDVADEVALVRRRTVNQSKGGGLSQRPITLGRAATTFGRTNGLRSADPTFHPRRAGSVLSNHSEASRSLPDLLESPEGNGAATGETFEEPFSNTAPRSQASLQRAASNAQRHRFQTLEERTQERVSVDSTGNFLPLPEYTEEPNAPLPSRFRAMAGLDAPLQAPPRPAIVTRPGGNDRSSPVPMTAPAAIGENFSAEQAFAAAVAESPHRTPSSNLAGMSRPIPRSLQRAYSNAVSSPIGVGAPPSLIGDWENVSPVVPRINTNGVPPSHYSPMTPTAPPSQDQSLDTMSAFQAQSQIQQYRHSTSLLNPPGHLPSGSQSPASPTPQSATAALPSGQHFGGVPTDRRVPPHMQAFRNAAASQSAMTRSASSHAASLFPTTQSGDYVPHRQPPEPASRVGHPITAWHPPAPGSSHAAYNPSPNANTNGNGSFNNNTFPSRTVGGGHTRKTSAGSKSAFASTTKARKLGFFKKRGRQAYGSGVEGDGMGIGSGFDDGKSVAGRSVLTWATGREKGCVVM